MSQRIPCSTSFILFNNIKLPIFPLEIRELNLHSDAKDTWIQILEESSEITKSFDKMKN